jgi:hypothetical protein
MSERWYYQIRLTLPEAAADMARRAPGDPALKPLVEILTKHRATMTCQFDAFAAYVAEAENHGTESYPLYAWTKATIEDPAKRAKHIASFAIHVDGQEVYAKEIADAIEAGLRPLVGGALIARLSKYDTNPANNPQPPASR